jgi:hypothetical protein
MPYYNDVHSIEITDTEHLLNSDIINKNREELFNEIIDIEKNKCKTCKYCNQDFNIILDLKKHVILNCFFNELTKRKALQEASIINISNDSNNTYSNCDIKNMNNCDVNINNINNINLYVDIPKPIPFQDDWDLSKISNGDQFKIMMSEFMYSKLLQSILENESNNNVIIDSDKKSGMVYINHDEKYISMKAKQIAEKSMEKLNEHLNIINKNNKADTLKDTIRYSRQIFNKKYIDFQKDKSTKNNVSNLVCSIYEDNKNKAQKMADNIVKIDNLDKQKKMFEKKQKNNEDYDSDSDYETDNTINKSQKGY